MSDESRDETGVEQGVRTWQLDSWEEFHALVANDLADADAFIFRGQTDAKWAIESTLDRLESRNSTYSKRVSGKTQVFNCPPATRNHVLNTFRDAIRGRLGSNPMQLDDDECWALAQHHGMATPMLDWTLSPFVALFFAFESEMRGDDAGNYPPPENRAIFVLSSQLFAKYNKNDEENVQVFSPTMTTSSRLVAQSGLFLKMPKNTELMAHIQERFKDDTYHVPEKLHPAQVLIKIVIKNVDRKGCLTMLNKMNINRMTLFPDLDGAARYINDLWEISFDTSLGHFGDYNSE